MSTGDLEHGSDDEAPESATGEEPADEGTADEEVSALHFELNDTTYCVEIEYIAEIINPGFLTKLPGTPPHIEGVAALRDEAVMVINLKHLFDLEVGDAGGTTPTGSKLVVFKRAAEAESRYGWLIDVLHGVETFPRSAVEGTGNRPGVEGVVQREDDFVIWLDPAEVRI